MSFPMVALGEVLTRVERFEERDDLEEFHFAGTYSFARGIFAGEKKFGSAFKLDKIQRIHAGDFVYCKIMAWEGAFGIVPTEAHNCVMSGAFVVYEVDQTKIDPLYLDFYFKVSRVWKSIGGQSTGTNIRRRSLHPSQFENAKIPLPPLAEQRRIVARIEELAAKIEEARGLRKKAVEESEEIIISDSTKIFKSIKNRKNLGEGLFDIIYRYPTFYDIDYTEAGIGLLKIGNLTQDGWKIDFTIKVYISPETSQLFPKTILEPGDVIMAARGATIGKTAFVTSEFGGFNINANLLRLKPNREKLDGKFFWYFMRSSDGQDQFQKLTKSTAKETVTVPKIKSMSVPIPPPPEQRRIVAYLDELQAKVDALRRLQAETGAELDALMPAVLDRAFKGEL